MEQERVCDSNKEEIAWRGGWLCVGLHGLGCGLGLAQLGSAWLTSARLGSTQLRITARRKEAIFTFKAKGGTAVLEALHTLINSGVALTDAGNVCVYI